MGTVEDCNDDDGCKGVGCSELRQIHGEGEAR